MKSCNACRETLPESSFNRRAKSPDGLNYRCRDCMKAYNIARYADPDYRAKRLRANREWHQDNKESARVRHLANRRAKASLLPRRPVAADGFKICGKCRAEKPHADYHRHGDGLAGYCKPCAIQHRREWYTANRDRAIATIRRYEANNPEWKRQAGRLGRSAYRARKHGATVAGAPVTAEAIRNRWAMWGDRCYRCNGVATETDHVIALSRGGLHVPANLRPICRSCNAVKSGRALNSI